MKLVGDNKVLYVGCKEPRFFKGGTLLLFLKPPIDPNLFWETFEPPYLREATEIIEFYYYFSN